MCSPFDADGNSISLVELHKGMLSAMKELLVMVKSLVIYISTWSYYFLEFFTLSHMFSALVLDHRAWCIKEESWQWRDYQQRRRRKVYSQEVQFPAKSHSFVRFYLAMLLIDILMQDSCIGDHSRRANIRWISTVKFSQGTYETLCVVLSAFWFLSESFLLQVFDDPKWKLEIVIQYLTKYIPKVYY